MNSKNKIKDILDIAGISINGNQPWDIKVHDDKFYDRVLGGGTLAVGESYMDGWWDVDALDQFFYKIFRAELWKYAVTPSTILQSFVARIFNFQNKSRASQVIDRHYDIGNTLYEYMLGPTMAYTCGYWKLAQDLDSAQYDKFDLVCRKMHLKSGMRILDVGCGWGGFMKFAVEKYGIEAVGVTLSKEQINFGRKLCAGLPIEFRHMDYRDMEGKFDHVISIGICEAVGPKNYKMLIQIVKKCLKDDGLFLLHTIGHNVSVNVGDPWIDKYIFPNGIAPSLSQIMEATEGVLVLEDLHNFGPDYDLTLMAWFKNFDNNWPNLKNDYDQRFYRMWKFYLLSCAGLFRARNMQLWQFVFSKNGLDGGYESVR